MVCHLSPWCNSNASDQKRQAGAPQAGGTTAVAVQVEDCASPVARAVGDGLGAVDRGSMLHGSGFDLDRFRNDTSVVRESGTVGIGSAAPVLEPLRSSAGGGIRLNLPPIRRGVGGPVRNGAQPSAVPLSTRDDTVGTSYSADGGHGPPIGVTAEALQLVPGTCGVRPVSKGVLLRPA